MTAAQDGQADVRALVDHIKSLEIWADEMPPKVRHLYRADLDELLAVVGQVSRADEAEQKTPLQPVDLLANTSPEGRSGVCDDRSGTGSAGQGVVARAAQADEARVQRALAAMRAAMGETDGEYLNEPWDERVARAVLAVVQPAQPDDDGLRQRANLELRQGIQAGIGEHQEWLVANRDRLLSLLDGTSGDQQDGAR